MTFDPYSFVLGFLTAMSVGCFAVGIIIVILERNRR